MSINQFLSFVLSEFLIYSSISFSSIYFFIRFLNIDLKKVKLALLIFTNLVLVFISIFCKYEGIIFTRLLFIILTCFVMIYFMDRNVTISLSIAIMCVSISYLLQILGTFIASTLLYSLNYNEVDLLSKSCAIFFQMCIVVLVSKIQRIQNGIQFIKNKSNIGVGLLFSGVLLFITCLGNLNYMDIYAFTILIICSIMFTIGLIIWIKKNITEHYRKKLQARADEHYQNTLAEKESQIEQLNNSNAFLSKIVHRDNHIMSSLQHTITMYKNCDNPTEKDKLLNEILTLAQERSDLIVKEQNNTKVLLTTGLSLIDGALSNMYIKATAHNIDFNLIINQDIHYLVNNLITQTDLETLLCDHIKDAIIAINSGEVINGKILVTVTMNDDIYEISIKDNGVDFEVDTLAKLGLERVTTHKDIGGSGIGFMTTFETLKKSNASLIITEYKTKTPFSKSITFRFDGLNIFIINSYRADLLKQSINRDDIVIM